MDNAYMSRTERHVDRPAVDALHPLTRNYVGYTYVFKQLPKWVSKGSAGCTSLGTTFTTRPFE